jgi:hypothetical protein
MPEYSQSGVNITDAVLRIDRSGLRTASKSNASAGNASAGNASAGNGPTSTAGNASAGNVTAGNATAGPPTACTIVLATPSGTVGLTTAQFEAQSRAYGDVVRRLNAGYSYGVGRYISEFGLIDATHQWGRDVWSGMGVLQQRYPHMYNMGGKLVHAWFTLPRPFSQAQARRPVWEDDSSELVQYYPALFAIFPDSMHHRMACLHILIVNSKPWWVHESRMVS